MLGSQCVKKERDMAFILAGNNNLTLEHQQVQKLGLSRCAFRRTVRYRPEVPQMCCKGSASMSPTQPLQVMFCSKCGTKTDFRKPPGDERERHVCPNCDMITYENPKVVVGCVPITNDGKRVLLMKRSIPPVGTWTFPTGFLELGETAHEGAAREAWEEARARISMNPLTLLSMYNILPAQQVQLLYRCTLLNEYDIAPGSEALEVRLFEWKHIPWDELAFPTVSWALQFSYDNLGKDISQPHLKSR